MHILPLKTLTCNIIAQTLYIIGRAEEEDFEDNKLEAQQMEMTRATVTHVATGGTKR